MGRVASGHQSSAMGNRNSRIHRFKPVFSPCMGGSSEAECVIGTAAVDAPSSSAPQACPRSGSGSNVVENWRSPSPKIYPRYFCNVQWGTLLEDGRFAFLVEKEPHDLRNLINQNIVMTNRKNCRPFLKEHVEEIMWTIALGMSWLQSRNIVHRGLKASNVLVDVRGGGYFHCLVADYECSIGVIGMGFFRAPEIVEACKDKSVSTRPELFTMSSDVYSYGMTCYEVLTGKLPFEGHQGNDYDLILNGARPKVPEYVDDWICGLLRKCWQSNPRDRPSFGEILNSILVNSIYIRKLVIEGKYILDR